MKEHLKKAYKTILITHKEINFFLDSLKRNFPLTILYTLITIIQIHRRFDRSVTITSYIQFYGK